MAANPAEKPQLTLVDTATGEVVEDERDFLIEQLQADLKGKQIAIGKLKRELKELRSVEPEAKEIREVLDYWRAACKPRAIIAPGGERWEKVRARFKDKLEIEGEPRPPWTIAELKLAVDGALLDPWLNGTAPKSKGYLDAKTIFKGPEQVERLKDLALRLQFEVGMTAKQLIEASRTLSAVGLDWKHLLAPCLCGHTRVEHRRSDNILWDDCLTPGCECGEFWQDYG